MEPEALHNNDEIRALSTIASVTPDVGLDVRELMTLMQEYRAAIREVKTKFEILDEDARSRLLHNPIHQISARLKTPTSLMEKIRRKNIPPEKEGMVHLVGMAALVALMVFVLFNDISKFL